MEIVAPPENPDIEGEVVEADFENQGNQDQHATGQDQ